MKQMQQTDELQKNTQNLVHRLQARSKGVKRLDYETCCREDMTTTVLSLECLRSY